MATAGRECLVVGFPLGAACAAGCQRRPAQGGGWGIRGPHTFNPELPRQPPGAPEKEAGQVHARGEGVGWTSIQRCLARKKLTPPFDVTSVHETIPGGEKGDWPGKRRDGSCKGECGRIMLSSNLAQTNQSRPHAGRDNIQVFHCPLAIGWNH